jgi:hypothetical protein
MFAVLALLMAPLMSAQSVREVRKISIAGTEETWQLRWTSQPRPFCEAGGIMWYTCPCGGFAFGEAGKLDVVRSSQGKDLDRLHLERLFNQPFSGATGLAILPHWPVLQEDYKDLESGSLVALVSKRPLVTIMEFGDYDHDGKATEFFLQTGTAPCAKRIGVIVGVSATIPRLHAFGTVKNPGKPLELAVEAWTALRDAHGPVRVTTWTCGDHGADKETEIELSGTPEGINARQRVFACRKNGTRGRLVSVDSW